FRSKQSHQGQGSDTLSTTGLADQARDTSLLQGEGDPVDGPHITGLAPVEHHGQFVHRQQRRAGTHGHFLNFGSSASRSDSPSRVKPSAARMMPRAGQAAGAGAPDRTR